jgi:hypothetical protein
VLLPTSVAAAAEPDRAGWWNRASAGSLVAPAPTTAPGDLRVAAFGPDQPAAYSALLFPTAGATDATLDLQIRAGSVTGTPEVAACPTETTEWKEGENQPYETAPPYDCEVGTAFGTISEDGATLSFLLDSSTQTEPGTWSLAIVPLPGSTSGPFTLDIVKPTAQVFQASMPDTSTDSELPDDTGSTDPGTRGGGEGEAFLPGGFEAPPSFDTGTAEAPLVAGGADTALPDAAAPAPTVADGAVPQAAGAPPTLLPVAPAGVVEDLGSGRRLLALLVLAGGSAAVGYAAGQQRPGPRLIGGRSRAGSALPAVPTEPAGQDRPRGIGRFAKTRDAAPRRLR